MHDQYIYGTVTTFDSDKQFYFMAVYGKHTIQDRKPLWDDLLSLAGGISIPWFVMGDFNVVLNIEDRIHRSCVQANEIDDFAQFVQAANMMDLKASRREFTWTNNHVFSIIDRGLVNSIWVQQWSVLEVIIMDPEFSDHSPLCVTIDEKQEKGGKPFKFCNFIAYHPEFIVTVQKEWSNKKSNNPIEVVWKNLSKLKHGLKKMKVKEFHGIQHKILAAKQLLIYIQSQMTEPHDHQKFFDKQNAIKLEI